MRHTTLRLFGAVLTAALLACGGESGVAADGGAPAAPPGAAPAAKAALLAAKVKLKDGADQERFSLKPKDDGAKVEAPDGSERARIHAYEDKLKLKGPDDVVRAVVKLYPDKLKLLAADGETEKAVLRLSPDGDLKLEGPGDVLLLRIKKRDYGYEVETPDDRSLAKAKAKDGKTVLRDAADKTLYQTKDALSTAAMACLALEPLTEDERILLLLGILKMGR